MLGIGQDFHEDGACVCAAMDFFDRIRSLRIDGRPGQKQVRIRSHGLCHIVTADEKVSVRPIQPACLIVDPVHTKQDGLAHMAGSPQFGDQSVGEPDRLRTALDEGTTVIAAHACSYGLMLYEKFLPTLQDFAKRYPNFYADISALTLPNRMGMLLHLRRHPELHDRLLFGTDYPLSVFHLAAWGRVGLRALRNIVRTTNRFDRQVAVCGGLGINFRSFGALIASSSPD